MKKVLMIIGGIVVGLVALGIVVMVIVSATSEKMKCEASEGSITIMYNKEKLTGYAANGIGYDFDQQREVAERVGIEAYLDEFAAWFKKNTDGVCLR